MDRIGAEYLNYIFRIINMLCEICQGQTGMCMH